MIHMIKRLLLLLPKTRFFDIVYHYIYFWIAHRRIPRRATGLFNDYLFFLKSGKGFDSALRQFVSDKDLVKVYYRGVLGEDLAPKTLKKFFSSAELVDATLPDSCVIKPAHLSGCIYYDSEVSGLNSYELERIAGWFVTNIYRNISRELNYRNLSPSVICEELIADPASVRDYKIFCYMGKPRAVQVDVERHSCHKRRMYTTDWEALPFTYNKPLAAVEKKPAQLDDALAIASRLACGFEFIRVDVYMTQSRVYLGEMTSVPENAHGRFETVAAERAFSHLIFE